MNVYGIIGIMFNCDKSECGWNTHFGPRETVIFIFAVFYILISLENEGMFRIGLGLDIILILTDGFGS